MARVIKRRAATQERVDRAAEAIESLRAFWPLTLRQIYYRLVAAGEIENAQREYKRLSRLLTDARIEGVVPWEAMEDRTRSGFSNRGWASDSQFVAQESQQFLHGYRRHLLQTQVVVPEVWVEKDALARVFQQAVEKLCVEVHVARGFSSISQLHELQIRIGENVECGQGTALLFFSDLDPSGCEMLPAMLSTLRERLDVGDELIAWRCALTPEQVDEYQLPRNPDALKLGDSRAKKFFAEYGDLAVELDAIAPEQLISLVRRETESVLDLDRIEQQRALEEQDQERLFERRQRVLRVLNGGAE